MTKDVSHYERLARWCMQANISLLLKRRIVIDNGTATVSVPFNPKLTQSTNYLHGAILFESADTSAFFAANSLEHTYSVLTADFFISFLRPVQGEGIRAVGRVVKRGNSLIVAHSDVYSDSDALVATGQGTYVVSSLLLKNLPGYA